MADMVDSASSEHQVDTCPLLRVSVTPRAFAKVDSQPLQELFGLTASSVCDVVLIAINFENVANIQRDLSQNLDSEVGLAVLDTRDFGSMSSAGLISTYNFASGSSDYQERARKKFLFGESVAITQNNMLKSIEFLVPPDRRVVFVGHMFDLTYGLWICLTSISRHSTLLPSILKVYLTSHPPSVTSYLHLDVLLLNSTAAETTPISL
jgi:hypothetical protein